MAASGTIMAKASASFTAPPLAKIGDWIDFYRRARRR
jgi:hypothetical protein